MAVPPSVSAPAHTEKDTFCALHHRQHANVDRDMAAGAAKVHRLKAAAGKLRQGSARRPNIPASYASRPTMPGFPAARRQEPLQDPGKLGTALGQRVSQGACRFAVGARRLLGRLWAFRALCVVLPASGVGQGQQLRPFRRAARRVEHGFGGGVDAPRKPHIPGRPRLPLHCPAGRTAGHAGEDPQRALT